MSGQDRIVKIISDLKVLSLLRVNQTLSTSSMTIIPHNAWSSSVWRRYAGEDRKQTISFIKGIFVEALAILKFNPSQNVFDCIEPALKGFASMKETYRGDYYTIAEVDHIIETIRKELHGMRHNFNLSDSIQDSTSTVSYEDPLKADILSRLNALDINSQEPSSDKESALEEYVQEIIREELSKKTTDESNNSQEEDIIGAMTADMTIQKICTNTNNETDESTRSEDSSNIEELVSTSDRNSSEETTTDTVYSCCSSNSSEDNIILCNDPSIPITSQDNIISCNNSSDPIIPEDNIIPCDNSSVSVISEGDNSSVSVISEDDNSCIPVVSEESYVDGTSCYFDEETSAGSPYYSDEETYNTDDYVVDTEKLCPFSGYKSYNTSNVENADSHDSSPIYSNDSSPVNSNDNSPIYSNDDFPINSNDNSPIYSNDNSPVDSNDNSPVNSNDNSPVNSNDNSPVNSFDYNQNTRYSRIPPRFHHLLPKEVPCVSFESFESNDDNLEISKNADLNILGDMSQVTAVDSLNSKENKNKIPYGFQQGIVRTDLNDEYSSNDVKVDQPDEFIKNIYSNESEGSQCQIRRRRINTESTEKSYSATFTSCSAGTSLGCIIPGNRTNTNCFIRREDYSIEDDKPVCVSMEYNVEPWREERSDISVVISSNIQSACESGVESQIRSEFSETSRKSNETTPFIRCPGFIPNPPKTKATRNIKEVISTPPIIRLAKAFKQWIDSITSDNDVEYEEIDTSGGVDNDNDFTSCNGLITI